MKKGFTLIELLAVIVILAIIALITVPTVLNIIENAKRGAAEDSAYSLEQAAAYYHVSNIANNSFVDTTFTCSTALGCVNDADNDIKLLLSGTVPSEGIVSISSNGTVTVSNLVIDGYSCTKTDNKYTCVNE